MEAGRGEHIKVFPLSEGSFTIGHDKQFMPFDTEIHELTDRPRGSLHVEVQPFLIAMGEDLILLDTGLGFPNQDGEMQIHANLRKLGISPRQITRVLLSHLHKDHAGALLQKNESGDMVPAFPEAAYYVYRPEAEFALATGYPSYHPEELRPLLDCNQVVWLDGTEGRIDEHITFRHSGGHSPQHIVFLIEDGNDVVFFGGDEAPQLKQMKIRYVAKYDFDGKRAMQLREQWAEEGRKAGWRFLFYHDIAMPEAKL